jgi:HAMP domain-containing protein
MGDSQLVAAGGLDETVLLNVLSDVAHGDFSARMPVEWTGVPGKIADRLNDILAANQILATELARVSRAVGKEGKLSQRVERSGSDRVWNDSIDSVNSMIEDLVRPTNEMQRVIGAVAGGDLSKKITADVQGEMLELKNTINAMVDQLNRFISEVTRVAA